MTSHFLRASACVAAVIVSLAAGRAEAQQAGSGLPSREQVEIPRDDALRSVTRPPVRSAAAAEPCPFATSPLTVDLQRVRFTQRDGAALPDVIVAALQGVSVEPGSQPLANLCAIRDRANEQLHAAGFVAAVAIPPQEITGGEARLHVTLARLVRVDIQGSPGPHAGTIAARIARLQALYPFNRFEAEQILLLAGDVPGLDVALSLRSAGTTPGEVIGDLAVRYSPYLLLANVQNSGSRTIGREIATLRGEIYGLTGLSDRTFVGVSASADLSEQIAVQAGHYIGDSRGWTAGIRLSHAWTRPDLGPLDIRSRSLIAGMDFSAPLLRAINNSLSVGGGFELIDQRTEFGGDDDSVPLTRDKLRILFATVSGSTRRLDATGATIVSLGGSLELRQGLDIFDATERGVLRDDGAIPSRLQGDPTATVLRGGVEGVVYSGPLSLQALVQGQRASNPLLSLEQFSVGNLTLGRGYDPGVVGGDHALGFRLEPRLSLPVARAGLQLFAFHDRVRVWNLDSFTGDRTLASSGVGARIGLPGLLLLEAMYARPHDRESDQPGARRASDRLLLSITTQFAARGR